MLTDLDYYFHICYNIIQYLDHILMDEASLIICCVKHKLQPHLSDILVIGVIDASDFIVILKYF